MHETEEVGGNWGVRPGAFHVGRCYPVVEHDRLHGLIEPAVAAIAHERQPRLQGHLLRRGSAKARRIGAGG